MPLFPHRLGACGASLALLFAAIATPVLRAAGPASAAAKPCIAPRSWSAARLAAHALVVPVDEGDVAAVNPEVRGGVGGLILLGSSAPASLKTQLADLVATAPGQTVPLVMVDEEGGAVQRLANLVGEVPSARTLGATLGAPAIYSLAVGLGHRLKALGVTMDLAPVLDADGGVGPNSTDADGTRSFSASPAIAAADGLAFAKGLRAGGVIPVVKHFPGLGGATGNTDLVLASTRPWTVLQRAGLVPFADAVGAGLPAVMVANAAVPGLSTLPASLSPRVITTELRGALGFHGLVLTDSLSAVSISGRGYDLKSAAVAALAAGADLVLFNAAAATTASVTTSIEQAIVAALATGALSRARLVAAASNALVAAGFSLCP
jgi:beta-N-acetylhexosaminidase